MSGRAAQFLTSLHQRTFSIGGPPEAAARRGRKSRKKHWPTPPPQGRSSGWRCCFWKTTFWTECEKSPRPLAPSCCCCWPQAKSTCDALALEIGSTRFKFNVTRLKIAQRNKHALSQYSRHPLWKIVHQGILWFSILHWPTSWWLFNAFLCISFRLLLLIRMCWRTFLNNMGVVYSRGTFWRVTINFDGIKPFHHCWKNWNLKLDRFWPLSGDKKLPSQEFTASFQWVIYFYGSCRDKLSSQCDRRISRVFPALAESKNSKKYADHRAICMRFTLCAWAKNKHLDGRPPIFQLVMITLLILGLTFIAG